MSATTPIKATPPATKMAPFSIRRRDGFETLQDDLSARLPGAAESDVSDTSMDVSPDRSAVMELLDEDDPRSRSTDSALSVSSSKEPLWRRRLRCAKQVAAALEKQKERSPNRNSILRTQSLQAVNEHHELMEDQEEKKPCSPWRKGSPVASTGLKGPPATNRVTSFSDLAQRWSAEAKDLVSYGTPSYYDEETATLDTMVSSVTDEESRDKSITQQFIEELNGIFDFMASETCNAACGPAPRRRRRRRRSY